MQWIHAGELARRHCEDHDLPKGTTPWSGLIGFRGVLAHSTESEVDFARVREFSQRDVRDYQRDVAEALGESG